MTDKVYIIKTKKTKNETLIVLRLSVNKQRRSWSNYNQAPVLALLAILGG